MPHSPRPPPTPTPLRPAPQDDLIPWGTLRYLIGEAMYGGRVSDSFDRRILTTYLDEYLGDFLFDAFQPFRFYACKDYEIAIPQARPGGSGGGGGRWRDAVTHDTVLCTCACATHVPQPVRLPPFLCTPCPLSHPSPVPCRPLHSTSHTHTHTPLLLQAGARDVYLKAVEALPLVQVSGRQAGRAG